MRCKPGDFDWLSVVRKLLKILIYLCGALVMAALALGFLVLEDAPLVAEGGAPTAEDVAEAREFVRGVRSAIQPGDARAATFVTNEEQLNRVIKLGARLVPGFRGRLRTTEATVNVVASIPVPYTDKWINLRASVPEFDGAFTLSELSVGPLSTPPAFALGVG